MRTESASLHSGLPVSVTVCPVYGTDLPPALIHAPPAALAATAGRWSTLRSLAVTALASIVALAAVLASAQSTLTWSIGSGSWDTSTANWTGSTWTNGSIATFGGTASSTITINEPGITAAGLTFTVAGDTITGTATNALGLTGAANVSVSSSNTATISAPVGGSVGMVKLGAGTLLLSGTNTYSGTTYIRGGDLQIGNTATIGAGDLMISGNDPLASSSRIYVGTSAGTVAQTVGTVTLAGEGRITSSATATLTSTGSFEMQRGFVGSTVALAGNVPLNKTTSDLVELGSATNTYSGTTTVSGGILRLGGTNSLPGGVASTAGGSHLVLAGGVIELAWSTTDAFARPLGSGAGSFEITGGAAGFSSSSGVRNVAINNSGVVTWGSQYFNPSTLILNDATGAGTLAFTNGLDLNNATRTIAVNSPTSTQVGVGSSGTRSGAVLGAIQGSGGLTKVGVGALVLAGDNSYDGLTTVGNGGVLSVQHANALGATTTGTVVESGAQLQLQPASAASSLNVAAEPLTLNGTGLVNNSMNAVTASPTNPVNGFPRIFAPSGNSSNTGALRNIWGTSVYNGIVTLGSDSMIRADAGSLSLLAGITGADKSLTVSLASGAKATTTAVTTGSGGLTVINPTPGAASAANTTFTLTGASTYTGTTTIRGGTLSLQAGATLNGSTGTPLTFTGSGTFLATDAMPLNMGVLTLTSGDATVTSAYDLASPGLDPTVVGFSSLTRAAGSTVTFANQGGTRELPPAGNFQPTTGNVITVGGQSGGFMGAWAFYGSTASTSTTPSGNGYAWYDATNGFVRDYRSTDADYVTVAASGSGMSGVTTTSNAVLSGAITGQPTATVNTVNLGANNFTMNSGTDVLGAAGLLSSGASAATFSGGGLQPAASGGELVVRVDKATDVLTVSSVIQDNSTASSLTKSGVGTLKISTAPTYTGTTTVANGVLNLFSAFSADSTIPSRTIVVNGGELQTTNSANVATSNLTFNIGGTTTPFVQSVRIANGGLWTGVQQLNIGNSATANGNSLTIDGVGSTVTVHGGNTAVNTQGFWVGQSGSNNSLTISNGGFMYADNVAGTTNVFVGRNTGANGNSLTVTGPGSTLSVAGQRLSIGFQGGSQSSPNTMTISNGGQVISRVGQVGGNQTSNSGAAYNTATISGANSLWSITEGMTVGRGTNAIYNGVIVQSGGTLYAKSLDQDGSGNRVLEVGSASGSNDNYITVTGTGSKFIADPPNGILSALGGNLPTATIGLDANANRNHVDVSDGGYWAMNWALRMGGVDSTINLGSSTGARSYGDFAGITMDTASARVNVQNATFRFVQTMAKVSGLGQIELKGSATFATDLTNSIDVPVVGAGGFTKEGTGLLSLTGANTYTGNTSVSAGTLVISGGTPWLSNSPNVSMASGALLKVDFSGDGTISSLVTGAGDFTKQGAGKLTLTNAGNNYTGNTSVLAGTLSISTTGTPWLSDAAKVSVASGAILDLAFSGTDVISSLFLNGVEQAAGTYGSVSSSAQFQSSFFTGLGTLTVGAVPEPETLVMLGAGVALAGFLHRRRRRA